MICLVTYVYIFTFNSLLMAHLHIYVPNIWKYFNVPFLSDKKTINLFFRAIEVFLWHYVLFYLYNNKENMRISRQSCIKKYINIHFPSLMLPWSLAMLMKEEVNKEWNETWFGRRVGDPDFPPPAPYNFYVISAI